MSGRPLMILERDVVELGEIVPAAPLRRISLHGLTAAVQGPRILQRTVELVLRAYPAPEIGSGDDLTISANRGTGSRKSWIISSENFTQRAYSGVQEAARWVEWVFISEALKRWDQFIHVHAGLVANSTQSALLIGRSGSGKSTTTTALALAGMQLYSDDVALVHREGLRPASAPRPIKLDPGARRLLRAHGLRLPRGSWLGESIDRTVIPGLPPVEEPGPPLTTAIFFADQRLSTPVLRRLTSAEAVMRLVQQSVSETFDASGPSSGAVNLINAIQCFELAAGDLGSTVSVIQNLLA
jgi:hypothetical protein